MADTPANTPAHPETRSRTKGSTGYFQKRCSDSEARRPSQRRTTASLSRQQQWRLRRLHEEYYKGRPTSTARGSASNTPAVVESGEPVPSPRWHQAMKQVLLSDRVADAVGGDKLSKDRKLTYWHGLKIEKSTKAEILHAAGGTLLAQKCRKCVVIVEHYARQAVEGNAFAPEARAARPPDLGHQNQILEEDEVPTAAEYNVVFDLFRSVDKITDLDSIYKKEVFTQLRILRLPSGSKMFVQGELQSMIYAVVEGMVQLKCKHVGVPFGAGTFGMGEVVGNIMPEVRQTTAECVNDTTLLCLDADRFAEIVHSSVNANSVAKKVFLKGVDVFSPLGDEDLNTLEGLFTTAAVKDNELLCREGARSDHLYVVKRGFFRLLKAFLPRTDHPLDSDDTSNDTVSLSRFGRCLQKDRMHLRHFDLGEIGQKDILGESGLYHQDEVASSPTVLTEDFGTEAGTIRSSPPRIALLATADREAESTPRKSILTGKKVKSHQEAPCPAVESSGATMPVSSAAGAASSSARLRQRRGSYSVSAVALRGDAQVYVANVSDLKRLQIDCPRFRHCLEAARSFHLRRLQAWDAQALAERLKQQSEWEACKRDIVENSVKLDRLKCLTLAGRRDRQSQSEKTA